MFRRAFVIVFYLVIIESSLQLPIINSDKECQASSRPLLPHVFFTVSSLYSSTTDDGIVRRQLEINWVVEGTSADDVIRVFTQRPQSGQVPPSVLEVFPRDHPGGYYRTEVEVPVHFFNLTAIDADPCLGYWVAYFDGTGALLSTSCLRIQPRWMGESEDYLRGLTLQEAMIPGSHDSGSFHFRREMAPLSKYKYAQDESIFNQLVYGIRYFDLRVGYYPNSEDRYYINHNFLRTEHSITSVLHQVEKFMRATKEFVILDFHNFPIGFSNQLIHAKLMNLIVKKLGGFMIPHNAQHAQATFGYLWKHGRRLLVSYDSQFRELLHPKLLWPSIPRAWGNKQDPHDLKTYFQEVFRKPTPKGIWASMAELTPNTRTIVLHPETGLRIYADKINRNVTHWFRDFYWQKANIVATDYFLGNDIIDVAIRTNRIKGSCPEESWPHLTP